MTAVLSPFSSSLLEVKKASNKNNELQLIIILSNLIFEIFLH